MKTIRLLYPDFRSGGLETYYLGAKLMAAILPENDTQPMYCVSIDPPDGQIRPITDGIYAKEEVLSGIRSAKKILSETDPDRVITIGGNCLVSLAPFDYLHGKYENTGIIWIDAHPDVSRVEDEYPNAHAMVLGSLLGAGDPSLMGEMQAPPFPADALLYVGLQSLLPHQEKFLNDCGVNYRVQTEEFVSDEEICSFIRRFDHILVHMDIDVLDPAFFASTYYANPALTGDGSGGGRMTLEKLTSVLHCITENGDVAGFTIAEFMPFDAERLNTMFHSIPLFSKKE